MMLAIETHNRLTDISSDDGANQYIRSLMSVIVVLSRRFRVPLCKPESHALYNC